MVFDAPRTAALQSCLLRTEGSGLGSLAEPPVSGVKSVERRVDCASKDEASCVKFIIGCISSDDEDTDPWSGYQQRRQQKRCRQKSEGSSGVSTHMSTSISNTSSSFASNFSADIDDEDEEDELESVDGDDGRVASFTHIGVKSTVFEALAPASLVVEQSNVLRPNDGNGGVSGGAAAAAESVNGPHLHEMSYLCVYPAPALEIKWQYFICGEFLVFYIPAAHKVVGLHDALITLLEYGEKNFQCSNAVVLIEKERVDKTSLERTFEFLGFRFAGPKDVSACLADFTKDYALMISDYSDLCDESDDDGDCESLFNEE